MRYHVIEGNTQKVDGGGMFGNCPKELWKKWIEPDELNRVHLAARSLLMVTPEGKKILFDAGIGAFFSPKYKERYGVEEQHLLVKELEELGYPHDEIDIVILSHLHFDHAGGILAPYEEGKEPSLLFPNAKFYVGEENFKRNLDPTPRDKASFIPYLPKLLEESGRLHLLKEGDTSPWGEEFSFFFVHGHTPGLMVVEVENYALVSDLIPGTFWLHIPIIMAFDGCAETSLREKSEFLERARQEEKILFFPHDPKEALHLCGKGVG